MENRKKKTRYEAGKPVENPQHFCEKNNQKASVCYITFNLQLKEFH